MKAAAPSILTVENADKYSLYSQAFQEPLKDVRFCNDLYQQRVGRSAVSLREDFCGTAAISCAWIQAAEERLAIAVDIDAEPLAWCRENLLPTIPAPCRHRIKLVHDDALSVNTPMTDIILALNSSFCTFKQRDQLLTYFSRCHDALMNDGMLVLGLYAGPEAQMVGTDELPLDGFLAVWEQAEFNAVTNEAINRIHFRFSDGSSITNAFVYDWRMWTPRELTDALRESGFRDACVYSRSQLNGDHDQIEECKTAQVSTYWDALVVGFK
jgi:hypothetical protein